MPAGVILLERIAQGCRPIAIVLRPRPLGTAADDPGPGRLALLPDDAGPVMGHGGRGTRHLKIKPAEKCRVGRESRLDLGQAVGAAGVFSIPSLELDLERDECPTKFTLLLAEA